MYTYTCVLIVYTYYIQVEIEIKISDDVRYARIIYLKNVKQFLIAF